MASKAPNEILDLIFDDMGTKDLTSLSITCRHFNSSANKALYSNITIDAPVVALKSKTKCLRYFLRTLITNPLFAKQVEKLAVSFSSSLGDVPQRLLAYSGSAIVCDLVSPDKDLFETAMDSLGLHFVFGGEMPLSVTYNVLLALITSQTRRLRSLTLD